MPGFLSPDKTVVSSTTNDITTDRRPGWLFVWISLTLGLAALPYGWAWLQTPPGQEFTGFLFNGGDCNTYMAKMEQGRQGSWVFHLAHTPETGGNGAVTYLFYLLLGKLAGLFSLSNVLVFHLARLAAGLFLLLASYRLIKLLFAEQYQRKFAFGLVCLSSGLGWLLVVLNPAPPDFWVAEGYTFLSIFANPHFPLATALLVVALTDILQAIESRQQRFYGRAALASFILGFVHPFMLYTLGGVAGLFWLRACFNRRKINWVGLGWLLVIGLAGGPGPFLTWWDIENDPLLKQWMQQNQTFTLDPITTLGGYGLLVPFGLAGFWWVERRLSKEVKLTQRWQLVTGWILVTVVLVALPINISRRFLEGIHLPLCCLATAGYYRIWPKGISYGWKEKTLTLVMAFTSIATVGISFVVLYLPRDNITEPIRSPYLSAGELGAFEWFRQNSQSDDVVITGQLLGNILPGRVLRPVFYGHSMETLDASHKYKQLEEFFDGKTPSATREELIKTWHLKFLLYGWREQKFGDFNPSGTSWPKVYDRDGVQIFRLS